jgi:hypothetical protein
VRRSAIDPDLRVTNVMGDVYPNRLASFLRIFRLYLCSTVMLTKYIEHGRYNIHRLTEEEATMQILNRDGTLSKERLPTETTNGDSAGNRSDLLARVRAFTRASAATRGHPVLSKSFVASDNFMVCCS